jgi:ribosomal protein S13
VNLSELFDLTQWIDREIKAKRIRDLYQNLQSILQSNTGPNRTKQPFENERNELIAAISTVPLESLSTEQVDFLQKLGIGNHIGEVGASEVEDILFRNPLDPATAAQKFAKIIQEIDQGIQKSDQLKQTLTGIIPPEPELKDQVLVRVTFSNEAAITNVVDLKNWSGIWYDIGRGVAMINDASPEEIQVVGAGKGSVVIELAVAYGIGKTIAAVILEALKVAEKVVDIRRKVEEIKGLKLSNSKIAKELQDAAGIEKKKGIESITETITKVKRKKDGTEGDKVVAFDKAVSQLVDFLEKGGNVDCVIPEEESSDESAKQGPKAAEVRELRTTFREIRLLERRLEQLEDKKPAA